jgi:2-dehydro-3-deoxygalactonokinase
MSVSAAFIGVDWGTSNGRFMLVDAEGNCLAERSAPGIKRLDGSDAMEATAFEALEGWPELPVIMAGTVGANIGWHNVPYVRTPASADMVLASAFQFTARGRSFVILPGVDTIRADGQPDIMRGEETQIFGALAGETGLVCLPGTHCKWARVEDGSITGFHSTMTGELLELVGLHSIMLAPKRAPAGKLGAVFDEGVGAIRDSVAGIEALLFTTRTRQVTSVMAADDADDYLAGLCIGGDVKSALALNPDARSVTLIGSPTLTGLYASALTSFGIPSRQLDGKKAVLAGLTKAWQALGR